MRGSALGVAVLGIFLLIAMLGFQDYVQIDSVSDLDGMIVNSRVQIEGVVESDRLAGEIHIMRLNGVDVVCDCEESYLDKRVLIFGVVEDYLGNKQVRAMEIRVDKGNG